MGEEMGDNRMKLGRGVVVEELGEPLSPQQTRKEKMNIINLTDLILVMPILLSKVDHLTICLFLIRLDYVIKL